MTYASASPDAPLDLAFRALADPTRRALIDHLRDGPRAVGELARPLPVSRPAVSQHLKVLTDAGLVSVTPMGSRRLYRIAPEGMAELRRYLDGLWDDALAAFATEARKIGKDRQ